MLRVAISAYSGRPPPSLEEEARRFIGFLAERCGEQLHLYVGGYRGLMKTIVDEALRQGLTVVAIIPVEYEDDDFPRELIVVSTGMSFKGRNVVLVRSGDILAAMGGGAGSLMEILASYGLARETHIMVGWGLPTDKLRVAYPDGRIGGGPRLLIYHENAESMADAICGRHR